MGIVRFLSVASTKCHEGAARIGDMFVNCSKRIGRLNEEAVELEHHHDSGLVQ